MIDFSDKRQTPRLPSFARIKFEGTGIIGHIADVSDSGFRVRSLEPVHEPVPQLIRAGIVFDEAGIPWFTILARLRWSKAENASHLFGCTIESFESFQGKTAWNKIVEVYTQGDDDGLSPE